MKLFSVKGRPPSRTAARNATLLNLFATPGLGSLLSRRWLAGTGQLSIFLVGFVLFCDWFIKTITNYYAQAFSENPPPVGHWKNLAIQGLVFCAVAWLWSAVTSYSLMREAETAKRSALENFAAPPVQKLADAKLSPALAEVPDWQLQGGSLVRTFEFKDFPAAIQFVQSVAAVAEEAWHHPDIDIRWNKVTLTLVTHDAGGLTQKDFALARKFDRL